MGRGMVVCPNRKLWRDADRGGRNDQDLERELFRWGGRVIRKFCPLGKLGQAL